MLSLEKFKISKINNYINVILKHPNPIRFALGYFLVLTRLCRFFTIQLNGYKIRFYPTSLSLAFFTNPKERYMDEYYLSKILKKGETLVDIGANIGTITIKGAQLVGSKGKVYAFEAHPKTALYLKENVKFNGIHNATLFSNAVGEKKDVLFFSDKGADDQNHVLEKDGIKVDVVRIDEVIPNTEKISMIKIDTEGYELPVIKGCFDIIDKVEVIYYESDEKHCQMFGYSSKDIVKYLTDNGFTVIKIQNDEIYTLLTVDASMKREYLFAVKDIFVFSEKTGFAIKC